MSRFDPNQPHSILMGEGKPKYLQGGKKYNHVFKLITPDDPEEEVVLVDAPKPNRGGKPKAKPAPRTSTKDKAAAKAEARAAAK